MNGDKRMPASDLPELLSYDPETGHLTYLPRPERFQTYRRHKGPWGDTWAGRRAFSCIDNRGYYQGTVLKYRTVAHRVVWALVHGEWPDLEIDHINGDKLDNRIENLRLVNRGDNARNLPKSKRNSSGVVGVCYDPKSRQWVATITAFGVRHRLCHTKDFGKAVKARKEAEARFGFHANHGRDMDGANATAGVIPQLSLSCLSLRQQSIATEAYPFPSILIDKHDKTTARSLQRRGYGDIENGASGEVLFRLNQDGENAVRAHIGAEAATVEELASILDGEQ